METPEDLDESYVSEIGKGISGANDTLNRGVLSVLLTPAFTVWGKKLGEFAEWTIREKKKNIQSHIDAVHKEFAETKTTEPTLKQAEFLSAWRDQAQLVDDEDPELAAMWRSVLEEILRKSADSSELVDIAKNLSTNDVRFLLKFQESHKSKSNSYRTINADEIRIAEKFYSLGILNRKTLNIAPEIQMIFLICAGCLGCYFYAIWPLNEPFKYHLR